MKYWWSIVSVFLIVVAFIFLNGLSDKQYVVYEDFANFPVPKDAKVLKSDEKVTVFSWSKASFENGLPWIYETYLKKNGWEKEMEDTIFIFRKDDQEIQMTTYTDEFTIYK